MVDPFDSSLNGQCFDSLLNVRWLNSSLNIQIQWLTMPEGHISIVAWCKSPWLSAWMYLLVVGLLLGSSPWGCPLLVARLLGSLPWIRPSLLGLILGSLPWMHLRLLARNVPLGCKGHGTSHWVCVLGRACNLQGIGSCLRP